MATTHRATATAPAAATHRTAAEADRLRRPRIQRAFDRAKILIAAYGALSAVVLVAVVVLALTGHPVTSFMWGRSGGVLASAAVLYWLTVLAARGTRWAYLRVRILSVLMPFVIVAVDAIPGVCPLWFGLAQTVCALPLAAAAFLSNGAVLRAAFPRKSPV